MSDHLPPTLPPTPRDSSEAATLPPTLPPTPGNATESTTLPPAAPPSDMATLGVPTDSETTVMQVAIPGYHVLGVLGRGGMGVVYMARQVKLNRPVALKMILAGSHAGTEELARFRAEAEAIARLQHPNIVAVYEVGEHEGHPFFSLEFCGKGSLEGRLDGTPLQPQAAAELTRTLAGAMQAAHDKGVVHRDLKPANVLIADDGTPKITDFGLAKKLDDDSGATRTGAIMGTPSYMAPEQAQARKDVGPQADVYALGAILYEMLTGRPPFRAATPLDTVLQVVSQDPVPPRTLNGRIPIDLETVCVKCLHKDPRRRYATAAELADDLKRFLAGEPVKARPVGRLERTARWVRRNPVGAVALGLVAALLVAAVAVPVVIAAQEAESLEALGVEQGKTQAALKESQENERKALRQAATSTLERAIGLCDSGEAGRGLVWLSHGLDLAIRAEDADLEEAYRWNLGFWRERVPSLVGSYPVPAVADDVALSPDDSVVAAACRDGKVRTWRTADGEPAGPDLLHPGRVHSVAFLPDGRTLLAGGEDGVARLWDVASGRLLGQLRHYSSPPPQPDAYPFLAGVLRVAVSPDGRLAITAGRDTVLRCWSLPEGRPSGAPIYPGGVVLSLAFSPDGQTLLTGQGWSMNRYDVNTRQMVGTPMQVGAVVLGVNWKPDGKGLAAGTMQLTSVERINLDGSRGALLYHRGWVNAVGYTPDQRWLVSAGDDQVVRWWNPGTGQPGGPPLPHGSSIRALAMSRTRSLFATGTDGAVRLWHLPHAWPRAEGSTLNWPRAVLFDPDGKRLLVAETANATYAGRVTPIDVQTGQRGNPVVMQALDDWVQGLALSPDGKTLYTTSNNPGRANRWDLATGKRLGGTAEHGDQVWRLALSPNGRRLATGSYDYVPAPKGCSARLWDAETGAPIGKPLAHASKVFGLSFRPDGTALLTGSHDHTTRLWDSATGEPLAEPFKHDAEVWCVAFHPDGKRALLGFGDGSARLWDVAGNRPAGPALRHASGIHHVQFLAGGRVVLACSADATARFWHVATGQPLGPAMPHTRAITSGCLNADERLAATVSDDKTVRVWPVAVPATGSPEQIRRAVEIQTNLVREEDATLAVLSAADWHARAGTAVFRPADLPSVKPGQTPPVVVQPPIPVQLVGPVEYRPATPEQVGKWLAALGTPEEEDAAKNLRAAGPAILPALDRAAEKASPTALAVMRQVRDAIERDGAVAPRRVTLKRDKMPIADAVAALSKETGLPVTLNQVSDATIDLDFRDVPAWQALDEFRRKAKLSATVSGGRVVLAPGEGVAPDLLAYPGPFRFQVSRTQMFNSRSLGDQPPGLGLQANAMLGVMFILATSPGERISGVGFPHCKDVRTNTGEALTLLSSASTFFNPFPPVTTQHSPQVVTLKAPTKPASTLSMSGTLPVEIEVPRGAATEITDPAGRLYRLIPLTGGGYVHLLTVQIANAYPSVTMVLTLPEGATFNPKQWSVELVEADGRAHRGTLLGGGSVPAPVRPEDLLWLAPADQTPWAALGVRARGEVRPTTVRVAVNLTTAPGPKARLRITPVERTTADLPFTFKDVPLP